LALIVLLLIAGATAYLAYDAPMRQKLTDLGRRSYHSVRGLISSAGPANGTPAPTQQQPRDRGAPLSGHAPTTMPVARRYDVTARDASLASGPRGGDLARSGSGGSSTTTRPSEGQQTAPVLPPGQSELDVARDLYRRGIDAEGRGDYAEALRCYQQINRMSAHVWPGDLKLRIQQAQRLVNGGR
jgi:hypothetical protein